MARAGCFSRSSADRPHRGVSRGQDLKSFEFKSVAKASHDWDKWLDGKIHQLTEGDDYACKTATFISLARAAAKKRGVLLRTGTVEGGVVIQAHMGEGIPMVS